MDAQLSHLHHAYHSFPYQSHDRDGLEELLLAGQIGAGFNSNQEAIHTASVNGLRETSDAARDTIDAVRDGINATNQIGNINLQAAERNGGETRSSVERTAGQTRDSIHFVANQTARDFAGVSRDICDGRREVAEGFGETKLEMAKQHCDIKLEAAKQHAEIKLEMCKQHSDLAAKLAECCCELKQENAQTRDLIRAQALDECRRRESDLQNEVNLLKITASLGGPGQGN